ncbi:MAG: PhpK family radical SAM P-methyltransferase [bacterium]|nr:PhpK family radical SAM P-methyltransferase [bacterium]
MKKTETDCLLIGHNEMEFAEYEEKTRRMGVNSGAYRDLNMNFINYKGQPYPPTELFNLFASREGASTSFKPLTMGETFGAAIAYLGTFLKKHELTYDFVNSFQEEKEQLKEKLRQDNILTIGIISTLYVSVFPILEIIKFIRQHNTKAVIIIGGPFVSTQIRTQDPMVVEYLFKSIDADIFVFSSQGETALVNIIQALKEKTPLQEIENIYYKKEGKYVATPIKKEDNPLSENTVNWDLFAHRVETYLNVRTSISCPFACSFCGFPQHAGKFQTVDVQNVERELDRISEIPTVQSVNFIDDTLNVPIKRYKEIMRMMKKKKYKFRWHSHIRCQYIDEEMLELMKENGCEGAFLGIESGNDEILGNMNKAVTVEKYYKGVSMLKKYGITTFGSFIIGFPGETEKTVQDTISFIKEAGLDFFRTILWYCEPITPIFQQKEKFGIQGSHFEWSHNTMNSTEGVQWIDHIFRTIDQPIWVPQYNFDYFKLFQLMNRGMSLDQVKEFLKAFRLAVIDKLDNPGKNMEDEIANRLKISCYI